MKKHPVGIAFSQTEKIQAANLTFLLVVVPLAALLGKSQGQAGRGVSHAYALPAGVDVPTFKLADTGGNTVSAVGLA